MYLPWFHRMLDRCLSMFETVREVMVVPWMEEARKPAERGSMMLDTADGWPYLNANEYSPAAMNCETTRLFAYEAPSPSTETSISSFPKSKTKRKEHDHMQMNCSARCVPVYQPINSVPHPAPCSVSYARKAQTSSAPRYIAVYSIHHPRSTSWGTCVQSCPVSQIV